MKKYHIRPNSPMDYIINMVPVGLIALGLIIIAGLVTTWDMGL